MCKSAGISGSKCLVLERKCPVVGAESGIWGRKCPVAGSKCGIEECQVVFVLANGRYA